MEPEDFCRWLQGVFDVSKLEELNEEQIAIVRSHLNTVFSDVTGYGMVGVDKKYRRVKPMVKDDSEQRKSDPNHKENAWKIDPSIKTVLTC